MDAGTLRETLSTTLDRLVDEALARGVSVDVARRACTATTRAFADVHGEGPLRLRRRAEAYYASVIRREIVRRRECALASARLVAATVAEDLARSGRTKEDVWDELQRGWLHAIPAEVLEEFRPADTERVAA